MIAFLNDDNMCIWLKLNDTQCWTYSARAHTRVSFRALSLSMKKKINDRKQLRTDHIAANLFTNNTWITYFYCIELNEGRENECVISNLIFYFSLLHSSVWLYNAGGWNKERLIKKKEKKRKRQLFISTKRQLIICLLNGIVISTWTWLYFVKRIIYSSNICSSFVSWQTSLFVNWTLRKRKKKFVN